MSAYCSFRHVSPCFPCCGGFGLKRDDEVRHEQLGEGLDLGSGRFAFDISEGCWLVGLLVLLDEGEEETRQAHQLSSAKLLL